jgi:hypothetical protein
MNDTPPNPGGSPDPSFSRAKVATRSFTAQELEASVRRFPPTVVRPTTRDDMLDQAHMALDRFTAEFSRVARDNTQHFRYDQLMFQMHPADYANACKRYLFDTHDPRGYSSDKPHTLRGIQVESTLSVPEGKLRVGLFVTV